jgi:hypothetical protein
LTNKCRCYISVMRYFKFPFSHFNLWSISHIDYLAFFQISIISFMYWSSEISFWNSFISKFLMPVSVLVIPGALFVSKLMYHYSVQSLSIITNCASFVSSLVICFASQIFAQMKKCFSGSSAASPQNYGNLMVGSCLSILNVELLPPHSVDT